MEAYLDFSLLHRVARVKALKTVVGIIAIVDVTFIPVVIKVAVLFVSSLLCC